MKLSKILWKIIDGILLITVFSMLLVVILQVLGRSFGRSIPWSEEMTRNLFVWTVNFGMVVGFRNVDHARVTFIFDLFKPSKAKEYIQLGLYATSGLVFFSMLALWNFQMTFRQLRIGETSPALGIPMFWVTLPMGICSVLALVAIVETVFFDKHTRSRILMKDIELVADMEEMK
jgi:TRAP-type C4-dicarboxylate transport system permease small subunit